MRRTWTAVAALALLASLLVGAAPARADYDDLHIEWIRIDTDDCRPIDWNGNIENYEENGNCILPDSEDGTVFEHDQGGEAFKAELWVDAHMVGKLEFHPYGEEFWIYDTASDGESFYVDACWRDGTTTCVPDLNDEQATNHPPNVLNRTYPEGAQVSISVFDGPNNHRLLLAQFAVA